MTEFFLLSLAKRYFFHEHDFNFSKKQLKAVVEKKYVTATR